MTDADSTVTTPASCETLATAVDSGAKKLSMIVMSGDFDKLFGAFTLATGGAAMGMEVTMFFTFWGLRAIKRSEAKTGKTLFGKMLNVMYGGGIEKADPSKFAFFGMGRWMFKKMMAAQNLPTLASMRDTALDLGVKMYACQTSVDVMEIPSDAFIKGVGECVGVAFFLGQAQDSDVSLFI